MAAVNSTMLPLGTKAPDFRLPDPGGRMVSLADFNSASALLVMFICNHCPYVKHIRDGLAKLARDYQPRGGAVVGINSNDVANYPADSPAKMAAQAASVGYTFPYLYDETQPVAKAYRAACTLARAAGQSPPTALRRRQARPFTAELAPAGVSPNPSLLSLLGPTK